MAYAFGRTVGEVAGDEDEIGGELVGAGHNFFQPVAAEGGADVQVAELGEAQAVQQFC